MKFFLTDIVGSKDYILKKTTSKYFNNILDQVLSNLYYKKMRKKLWLK